MDADFLVIGGGLAGLTFALEAAAHGSVLVLTKTGMPESNTTHAQGGIASVWSPEDSFDEHIEDTMVAGAGLCHRDIVEIVVCEGPDRIRDLIARGIHFSLRPGKEDEYDLGREGGHSRRRVLHASDATGQEIMRALVEAVRRTPAITVLEDHIAIDLLIDAKSDPSIGTPSCWGVYALDKRTAEIKTLRARATVLATGGAGKVYLYTTNPDIATGDGVALAYRAGVPIANMEFIQFHPTCLFHPAAKSFLISEALRGEGAVLRRPDGVEFMKRYDARAELAPRDIVARAIDSEMKVYGFEHVYLDITHKGAAFVRERFPTIHARCLEFGIDITRDPIPVVPAAHYCCGGVLTDADGVTTVRRLYAAGEVAMTGLHGANRLASNSLLEAMVFGHRSARHAVALIAVDRATPPDRPAWNPGAATDSDESVVVTQNWDEIRRLMWNYVGIVRSNRRLARALKRITLLQEEIRQYYWDFKVTADLIELRNIALVAELIIIAAITRKESRGLHYTIDYPEHDDTHRQRDTIVTRGEQFAPDQEFLASLYRRRASA
ncbi:MAG: L-aspartate oxidase [Deltaproteobacteria bacterium]|nr:L-aspartate oxidase [Deltaproteobacteria bacterium]MBI3390771.1 L-aspartate oxidase [Deltaproteobacteria bacterium]